MTDTNLNEALEMVREALENPLCIEKGNIAGLKWREHDATAALAALPTDVEWGP